MVAFFWVLAFFWVAVLTILTPGAGRWLLGRTQRAPRVESVSILLSARNEESRVLVPALRSMLEQDYEGLKEIIVVDDRSTDNTLALLRGIQYPRLRVLEGTELPPSWIGKPHGLDQAQKVAGGDWLLITDADILFERSALSSAMLACQQNGWEVLSLWPKIECHSFWERLIMPVDLAVTAMLFPLERVNGNLHRDAFTIGGFTLMRHQALRSLGGFSAVRHEVADDFALGILFKQAGYKLHMGFAPDLLRTRDYAGLAEIWQGLTRKLFSNFTYIPMVRAFRSRFREIENWRLRHRQMFLAVVGGGALLVGAGGMILTLVPLLGWSLAPLPAFLAYAVAASIHRQYARMLDVHPAYSLGAPLAYGIYAAILWVAAGRVLGGKGLTWRGRRIY